MRNRIALVAGVLTTLLCSQAAYADATLFVGVTRSGGITSLPAPASTPSSRPVRGFAAGLSLIVVGFEVEYADTGEDPPNGAPSLRTGMINVLLQTPAAASRVQVYGTIGGGLYRERLGRAQETAVGVNTGGGVKLPLAGPLRLRLDYRIFTLRGSPRHPRSHRFYAGLNLAF